MSKNNTKKLQPLLDYFEMLHTYEQKGFLEVASDKHQAYITRAALLTLSPGEDVQTQLRNATLQVVRYIHMYAVWKASISAEPTSEPGYTDGFFALHVVTEDAPHDPLYTLLHTYYRRWFTPWRKTDRVEVITY